MPTFRSLRNPAFWIKPTNGSRIQFVDSVYSTDDPAEVAILRRRTADVEEVSIDAAKEAYVAGDKSLEGLEADVTAVVEAEERESADELSALSRVALNDLAAEAGIPDPEKLPRKQAVIDALNEQLAKSFDPNDPDGS